jgi:hypothetical protein
MKEGGEGRKCQDLRMKQTQSHWDIKIKCIDLIMPCVGVKSITWEKLLMTLTDDLSIHTHTHILLG